MCIGEKVIIDPKLRTEVSEALAAGTSALEMMQLMPVSGLGKQAALLKSIVRDLMNSGEIDPVTAVIANPEKGYADLPYTEVLARFNAMIKRSASPVAKKKVGTSSGRETTIVLGDLHIPEHRFDYLTEIAKRYEGSRLIIAGDLMDFQRFSKFNKKVRMANRSEEQKLSTMELLKTGTAVVDAIRPYFSDVVIKRGNHDERLASILSVFMSDGAEVADFLFESMFAGMDNVTLTSSTIEEFYMVKRGDAWIGHWDICGKAVNKGANDAVDWMLDNDYINTLGEWNVLVQLHTHKVSLATHRGKLAVECGCMSNVQDYVYEKPGKFGFPRNGYFELVQYDGITDWEESGVRMLRDSSPHRQLK